MIYKRLGKTGLSVSRLGFGGMRLPSLPDGKPDHDASVELIHRAFELGVNYIDTAVMYCNSESQTVVGKALKGWRDRVYVSTKNHYSGPDERAWWRNLEDSLERLAVEYVDVYSFHGINWKVWEEWVKGPSGVLSWFKKARARGLIKHICCSFHDDAKALKKIAETDEFSSITLQYNLLYRELEPVLPELVARDIGVVVMGPVGGGQLGGTSETFTGLVEGVRSTAEIAMRFVLANPNVTAAISGMNELRQLEENCAVASHEEPLSKEERRQVEASLNRLKGLAELYCTGCNYCMPCPHGVDIPANFSAVNYDRVYGLGDVAKRKYSEIKGQAVSCVACGECEPKCPQKIPIRAQLGETAARFGG